ncbi:NIPSNAP family protein [Thermodesulfobacteriota bacterium]
MAEKRVLMITKVDAVWNKIEEFHMYWEEKSLPVWEENSAKHIGSFVNYLGGPKNQIVRLFEFESISAWDKFMQHRQKRWETESGQASLQKLFPYLEKIEETVWTSAYD